MTSAPIILVDDDDGFREATVFLLEAMGHRVTAFPDGRACLEAVTADPALRKTAIFLLDVRMPGLSGLQLLAALERDGIAPPTIFLTGHGDVPLAVEAMRLGAATMLEKPLQPDSLRLALDRLPATAPERQRYAALSARLTPREREVRDLVVEGRSNKMVAIDLGISPKTVELHRARVMAKMEAQTLTDLVRRVITRRIEPE